MLNQQYGYFNEPSLHLRTLFTDLAIACRTMIVLFEQNNTQDDTMAYDYAFKLMALYIDPKHPEQATLDTLSKDIYTLVNAIDNDKIHPFHEALLVQLEPLSYAGEMRDRDGWRNFVQKHGVKAFQFFKMAEQIEQTISQQPGEIERRALKTLQESNAIYMLCRYKRADEDAAFAHLCHQYKVPEAMFENCLNYTTKAPGWPKKEYDNIPNLTIRGHDEAEGLYWVKLPTMDKRALILGQITDCCQSISGNSEQCVKDAVSLNDNGLYVLVKQRKKGSPALIEHGQMNERDFKIIGQSYVWRSLIGNLCLDLIECLKDEVTNEAIKSIITDFANQVLQSNPDIKFVTVGRGGKTPGGVFDNTETPERIRQGMQYGDSNQQYCIAKAPLVLNDKQRETLQTIFTGYPDDCLDYLMRHVTPDDSNHFMEALQTLFIKNRKAVANHAELVIHNSPVGMTIALLVANQTGFFTGEKAQIYFELLYIDRNPIYMIHKLEDLKRLGFLDGENSQIYIDALKKQKKPSVLADSLIFLKESGLLDNEKAQVYFDLVIEDKDGDGMAPAPEGSSPFFGQSRR